MRFQLVIAPFNSITFFKTSGNLRIPSRIILRISGLLKMHVQLRLKPIIVVGGFADAARSLIICFARPNARLSRMGRSGDLLGIGRPENFLRKK